MRIYCVWTRIVASIPPLPRLRYCPKLAPLSLLSFLLVASLKKKGSSLFSFWKYRCSFVRRIGIITDFRLLLSLSLSCSSPVSLIFLARVGQTFSLSLLRRVRKSDDTSNEVAAKLARVNAIISLFRLSFLRGRIWIEERKICFLAYFEGERGAIGVWNLKEGDGRRMARSSEQV